LATTSGLPFAEHLSAQSIRDVARQIGYFFRERIFTPAVTLWTFLSQVLDADHSCRQAVARVVAHRAAHGQRPCSPDTGAYCKARERLPEKLLEELTCGTGRQLLEKAPVSWLWMGRRVKVVDGTSVSMPDTPKNQKAYPKLKTFAPGVGFPSMRLVAVFSLAVGTILAAALGRSEGKGTGEPSLFRQLLDQFQRGDVLLGDQIYGSYWNVAWALAHGVEIVARLKGSRTPVNFRGHRGDSKRIWWRKPQRRPEWMSEADYEQAPDELCLRAVLVTVRRAGFRTRRLVLVTTLLDTEAITRSDLADLYRARWQAELYLRSIKQSLQMDILRGRSPEMVRKEVWAHLLVYNLVRTIMAHAAAAEQVRPDEISFTGALQTINSFLPHMHEAHTPEQVQVLWEVLLWAVGSHRVGNRPNRIEPRAVKRRPKSFMRLTTTREEARRQLRKKAKYTGRRN
jgi:hypothetical protein